MRKHYSRHRWHFVKISEILVCNIGKIRSQKYFKLIKNSWCIYSLCFSKYTQHKYNMYCYLISKIYSHPLKKKIKFKQQNYKIRKKISIYSLHRESHKASEYLSNQGQSKAHNLNLKFHIISRFSKKKNTLGGGGGGSMFNINIQVSSIKGKFSHEETYVCTGKRRIPFLGIRVI